MRDFAVAQGIASSTLYWWRSKLRRDRAALVPVRVVEPEARHEGGATPGSFEVLVDGAMTLRVPAGFDEAELRRLIRALRC